MAMHVFVTHTWYFCNALLTSYVRLFCPILYFSCMLGEFKNDSKTRTEFLTLIQLQWWRVQKGGMERFFKTILWWWGSSPLVKNNNKSLKHCYLVISIHFLESNTIRRVHRRMGGFTILHRGHSQMTSEERGGGGCPNSDAVSEVAWF